MPPPLNITRKALPMNIFLVVDTDLTKLAALSSDPEIYVPYVRNLYVDSSDVLTFIGDMKLTLKVNRTTGELYTVVYTKSITYPGFVGVTDTNTTNMGIFLENGINKISFQGTFYYGPGFSGVPLVNQPISGYHHYDFRIKTETGIFISVADPSQSSTGGTAASPVIVALAGRTNRIDWRVRSYPNATYDYINPITMGVVVDFAGVLYIRDGIAGTYWGFLEDEGHYIPLDYITTYFFGEDEYFSLIDKKRDIALIPSVNHGKVILLNGGVVPEEYSDRMITVTGPRGLQGDTGATGDTGAAGAVGYSYVDGGVADSLYQTDLIIDGGGA